MVTAVGPSAEQRVWHWRLAAKAKHPNLVEIYKAGRAQLDGIFIAYVVMEFAEENLGQVLPERPLTTEEARAMLGPAMDALAFLHGDGFVHGALKPANIMAVQDCLKLSSDSLRRIEDSNDLPLPQGSYRAPELASGAKLSQAADIWALGVTLVESLTQQPPVLSESEPLLPDGIDQPFLDVVRHCLRPLPQERWTANQIVARLDQVPPIPGKSRSWLYAMPAAVLLIVAVFMGIRSMQNTTSVFPAPERDGTSVDSVTPPAGASFPPPPGEPAASASTSAAAPAPPVVNSPEPAPAPVAEESAVSKPAPKNAVAVPNSTPAAATESAPPTASSVVPSGASAANGSSDDSDTAEATSASPVSPDVITQVMPDILAKARRSIHGKVDVALKVQSDAYGAVKDASVEPPPASRYFSTAAVKAVRRWKFRPTKSGDTFVPQQWIVRFEFTRTGTKTVVERATP